MEPGFLIPIGNNGWLIPTTSLECEPSFDLNNTIVRKAEGFGFDCTAGWSRRGVPDERASC